MRPEHQEGVSGHVMLYSKYSLLKFEGEHSRDLAAKRNVDN